jgi:hypothetical protein
MHPRQKQLTSFIAGTEVFPWLKMGLAGSNQKGACSLHSLRVHSGKANNGRLLLPVTEVSEVEMVFDKELARRAEATDLFYCGGRGLSAGTEELGGLVFFQGVVFVTWTHVAVFPAGQPVLLRILDRIFVGVDHEMKCAMKDNSLSGHQLVRTG